MTEQTDNKMIKADISSEEWREYDFVTMDSRVFTSRITSPVTLYIKSKPEGDTHRVVDKSGVTHYIPARWFSLRWKANPEVSF